MTPSDVLHIYEVHRIDDFGDKPSDPDLAEILLRDGFEATVGPLPQPGRRVRVGAVDAQLVLPGIRASWTS